ncbi:hypothetical protein RRG08_025404 [Elysia crispata]|uniref:Uncharacterized protein n=1 Tax=Elysia crispata TaxID=231223 RepID=A0AAE1DC07_9GAST|nr:hypothetical protein RRG08_025404 [Elysia crispata]
MPRKYKPKAGVRPYNSAPPTSVAQAIDNYKNGGLSQHESIDGVPPQNIVNYNETNLTDDPGRKRLIFKRGIRYPERIMHSTKTSASLMLAVQLVVTSYQYMLCTNQNPSGVHELQSAHTKLDLTDQSQAGSTMCVLLTGSSQ